MSLTTPTGRGLTPLLTTGLPPDDPVAADKLRVPTDMARIQGDLESNLRRDNAATASLFHELCKPEYAAARIVAHSQGNLIANNALRALVTLRGKDAITGMSVYAIGSPVRSWVDCSVREYSHANDPVAKLSGHYSNLPAYAPGWTVDEETQTGVVTGVHKEAWQQVVFTSLHSYPLDPILTLLWDLQLLPMLLSPHNLFAYLAEPYLWSTLGQLFP